MSSWSQKKQDKFAEILFDMGQQQSLQSTIGESPLFAHTDSLGRLITTLVGYPMQQFNVHGVAGGQHLDRTALMQTAGAFMGSYLGLNARYAMLDKDVDQEQLAIYAMMNIAPLGILASSKSMLDPATMTVAADIIRMSGIEVGGR